MKTSLELHEAIASKIIFPESIVLPWEHIGKRGFFPVCSGTIDGSTELSDKSIMVVGQDFGKVADAEKAILHGEDIDRISTWKQLRPMLKNLGIDENKCFYTNYLMGVRDSKSNMGASTGLRSKEYVESCLTFFEYQVSFINPKVILFLGKVAYYLAQTGADINEKINRPYLDKIKDLLSDKQLARVKIGGVSIPCAFLIHPSQRKLNIINGRWSTDVEIKMKEAFEFYNQGKI